VAQVGWIAVPVADSSVGVSFLLFAVLIAIELSGPLLAEKRMSGTPWHAHHIVERKRWWSALAGTDTDVTGGVNVANDALVVFSDP
jgi:Bacterial low temperature requirement A protein (LtrA)